MSDLHIPGAPASAQANDPASLERLFGTDQGLLPLWIAEPYLPLDSAIVAALESRANIGWFGYEVRPSSALGAFRSWSQRRHGWDPGDFDIAVSPSLGTSIGAALELVTEPGDAVILQPPVFTDFKPLVTRSHRKVARNSLLLGDGRYVMDFEGLEALAERPDTTAMILCSPHNPVGRVWTADELSTVAEICSAHGVFVISDEIHSDIMLGHSRFTPFARAAAPTEVRWIALHGPIKTFGLAGVADTVIVTGDDEFAEAFSTMSSRLHLTRNNVFSIAATEAAYTHGDAWLDEMLVLIGRNVATLRSELPDPLRLIDPDGTYLAWIDLRGLELDVPQLTRWLPERAHLALSPGHWFGREGAGFARMSIAVAPEVIEEAIARLTTAT
ncbi:MAG: aminotransferase class I/II-fold pyridoxal phosphate-dependent enzyme, partial [Actinomycetia bacterium]|nr:aminotransferase class I/II-fold pyridoxal phosphate-dependent enzyme [Actinomycetes bacterium]